MPGTEVFNPPPPGIELTIAETEVFSGTSPTTWTDLDLSGTIGAKASLVLLKVYTSTNSENVGFRKNGDTDEQYSATGNYSHSAAMFFSGVAWHAVWVATDNAGIVEWKTLAAQAYTVDVVACLN